jgi:hypothetical protein
MGRSLRSARSKARDLLVAMRTTTTDAFSPPAQLAGVSTSTAEHDRVLSADGCELWFASDRVGDFDSFLSTVAP